MAAVATTTATAAEHFLKNAAAATTDTASPAAEDFAEDVEGVMEAATTAATKTAHATGAAATTAFKGGVTVAVVGGAFLRILEHLVGVGDFLELLLGGRVSRIFVRVILHRLFAIGLLEFVGARFARDAKQIVVVFFRRHRDGGRERGSGNQALALLSADSVAGPPETITAAGRRSRPLRV